MTNLLSIILLSSIPVLIILLYVYIQDKNKEPINLLIKLFVLGIISAIIVLFISQKLFDIFPFMEKNTSSMTFIEVLIYSFIGVALLEELAKWVMTYIFGYKDNRFDEIYDIIVYAVFVSLGFAFFENTLYIMKANDIVTGLQIGLLRGLLSIPGHACDAVFMGYYLSLAKQYTKRKNKKLVRKNILLSILVPTILHGIYDFCLFSSFDILIYVFFAFVIFLYMNALEKLKKISHDTTKLIENK